MESNLSDEDDRNKQLRIKIRMIKEKLKEAHKLKDQGNEHFKNKENKKALRSYHKALLFLKAVKADVTGDSMFPTNLRSQEPMETMSEAIRNEYKNMWISVHNDLALVLMATDGSDPEKIIHYSDIVLKEDKANEKAWYRRGVALMRQGKFDIALESFERMKHSNKHRQVDSKTRAMMKECINELTIGHVNEIDMCKKMFSASSKD